MTSRFVPWAQIIRALHHMDQVKGIVIIDAVSCFERQPALPSIAWIRHKRSHLGKAFRNVSGLCAGSRCVL
jgi:hypothetical protein